ncbi:MAG: hypothetical protein U0324_31710 [Polyangiales bacterium]
MAAAFGYAAARYPMLPHAARPGLAALLATLLACTSSYRRCQPGYEQVPGASPLQCRLADAGAGDGDGGGDADVPRRMCGARVCDEPGDGIDTNGDMVDGESTDTVFVSETGSDTAVGTLPNQPVRSLPTALERAREANRGTILIQAGSYDTTGLGTMETPRAVTISRTVRILGRYSSGQWLRRNAMGAGGETRIVVPIAGAIVLGARDVLLWGMTLEGRTAQRGASAYGLVAIDAPELVLREVALIAGGGADGAVGRVGDPGADGLGGQSGASDGTGGRGGPGCAGIPNGGVGGSALNTSMMAMPATAGAGVDGRAGGTAGMAGTDMLTASEGGSGVVGMAGLPGRVGGTGLWTRDGFAAERGGTGETGGAGTGGGGGGAGFTAGMPSQPGGGGGGGGGGACGGGGGEGGEGGGASIGAYLFGRTTVVRFERCSIATGRGGNGAVGGVGGGGRVAGMPPQGGAGGAGVPGATPNTEGANGGRGGAGGIGGRGGPGLGGPSVGIARIGGASSFPDLETQGAIRPGLPGMHAAGAEMEPPSLSLPEMSRAGDEVPDGGAAADAAPDAPTDAAMDAAAD